MQMPINTLVVMTKDFFKEIRIIRRQGLPKDPLYPTMFQDRFTPYIHNS
jgi:hypothetical protein